MDSFPHDHRALYNVTTSSPLRHAIAQDVTTAAHAITQDVTSAINVIARDVTPAVHAITQDVI